MSKVGAKEEEEEVPPPQRPPSPPLHTTFTARGVHVRAVQVGFLVPYIEVSPG